MWDPIFPRLVENWQKNPKLQWVESLPPRIAAARRRRSKMVGSQLQAAAITLLGLLPPTPRRSHRAEARLGFAVTDISFRSPKVKAHKKFLSSVFVLASLKLLLAQEHLKSDDFPFTFSYTLLCHSACCENISSYLILFNGRLPRKGNVSHFTLFFT